MSCVLYSRHSKFDISNVRRYLQNLNQDKVSTVNPEGKVEKNAVIYFFVMLCIHCFTRNVISFI